MVDATLKGIPREQIEKAIRKTVGPHGRTCGAVYVANRYIGRKVIVVILKETGGESVAEKNC
jgi:putative transposon-encoded protein